MKNFTRYIFVLLILSMISINAQSSVVIDGIYYNLDENSAEVTYASSTTSVNKRKYQGDIVIPEIVTYNSKTYSVTEIGEAAFKGCENLTSIKIPNSVTSIGKNAFTNCI